MSTFEICLLVSTILAGLAAFGVGGRVALGWLALAVYFGALLFVR